MSNFSRMFVLWVNVSNKSGGGNHHFRRWKTTPDILRH